MRPHIINPTSIGKYTKWFNGANIITRHYDTLTLNGGTGQLDTGQGQGQGKLTKDLFYDFIAAHYLRSEDQTNTFMPMSENIDPYFVGHSHPCFISFYNSPTGDIAGLMTSRPLCINFHGTSITATATNTDTTGTGISHLYYVDYLCVAPAYRKKGCASQLIQTHEYWQRKYNGSIQVSLFKHETDILGGVLPLVMYTTCGFNIRSPEFQKLAEGVRAAKISDFHAAHKMVTITKTSMGGAAAFINTLRNTNTKTVFICPSLANIMELVESNNIYMHAILNMNTKEVIAVYFYRNTCVCVDGPGTEVLTLVASLQSGQVDADEFFYGFVKSFMVIAKRKGVDVIGYCGIEGIGDNLTILETLKNILPPPNITSPTAYFFYNYRHPTVKADSIFILN
jgi:GNAT superfamily N-acetyltransferase